MSKFLTVVASAVKSARSAGLTPKLSTMRDAISFALVDMPYSQAIFSDRNERLRRYDAQSPEFLVSAATRFGIEPAVLADVLRASAGTFETAAYLTVGPSTKLVVNELDEIAWHEESAGRPLYRLVYSDPRSPSAWGYCWAGKPTEDEVFDIAQKALRKDPETDALICPAALENDYPSLVARLQASGINVRRPASKKEMARSDVVGWEDQMVWIRQKMRGLGEGNPLISEIQLLFSESLIEIPKEKKGDVNLARLDVGQATAEKICSSRGRIPKIQKLKRQNLPHFAPQAVAGAPAPAVDAVDCLIDELSSEQRWVYDEDRLAIACAVKEWERASGDDRQEIEEEIGHAVMHFAIDYKRDQWSGALWPVEWMFGQEHSYGPLMVEWCLRELAAGLADDEGVIRGRELQLQFREVGLGPWLKSLPAISVLSDLVLNATGATVVLPSRMTIPGPGNSERKWRVHRLIDHAANFLCGFDRDDRARASTKANVISARQGRFELMDSHEPLLLDSFGEFHETTVNLQPWIEAANAQLEKWGAGCRIADAQIVNPAHALDSRALYEAG